MMLRRGLALPVICALALSLGVAAIAYAAADDRMQLERLNVRETVLNAEQGRNLNRMARLLTALAQFRRDPPPAPRLADVRQKVENDWRSAATQKAVGEAYVKLLEGYDVVIERP